MASSSCANSPPAYASYDVLVHQLAVLLAASFKPNLAVKLLPFASSDSLITTWFSTVIFLQGTYTPLVHAHAGRTQSAVVGLVFRCAPNQPQSAALGMQVLTNILQITKENITIRQRSYL